MKGNQPGIRAAVQAADAAAAADPFVPLNADGTQARRFTREKGGLVARSLQTSRVQAEMIGFPFVAQAARLERICGANAAVLVELSTSRPASELSAAA